MNEQLQEVREELLDIENLLQLLEVNLQDGEEDSYIRRSVRLAGRLLNETAVKLDTIMEDCGNS
ncbi:hypothetical protein [Eisenbergiella tayi]|uniref:hypothetical protein n=1 Tax=Eisenbergiella tayi TaxID=1432052 RepID=UPI000848CB5C|nr:hypothetical protein [Eisenbergiella tayi]ODR37590.1 hypothetical protein BEI60_10165 [Eisenbergiella tayi]